MADEDNIDASRAPLLDHLIELRKRLLISLVTLALLTAGCLYFSEWVFGILVHPLKVAGQHKLIYTATWQIPFTPVDFAGDAFWKELQQMHKDGKLDPLFERLYFSPTRPMFELFDLEADPSELKNLIGTKEAAGIEKELKAALQEWMILQRDFLPLPVPPR